MLSFGRFQKTGIALLILMVMVQAAIVARRPGLTHLLEKPNRSATDSAVLRASEAAFDAGIRQLRTDSARLAERTLATAASLAEPGLAQWAALYAAFAAAEHGDTSAVRGYLSFIEADIAQDWGWAARSRAYEQAGRIRQAAAIAMQSIGINDVAQAAEARFTFGRLALLQNDSTAARAAFRNAIRIAPASDAAKRSTLLLQSMLQLSAGDLTAIARSLARSGQTRAAVAVIQAAAMAADSDLVARADAQLELSAIEESRGEVAAARTGYQHVMSTAPASAQAAAARLRLGILAFAGESLQTAEDYFRAAELASSDSAHDIARYWRGRALLARGDAVKGRALLLAVAAQSPLSYYGVQARTQLRLPPTLRAGPAGTGGVSQTAQVAVRRIAVLQSLSLNEAADYELQRVLARMTTTSALHDLAEELSRRGETARSMRVAEHMIKAREPLDGRLLRAAYPLFNSAQTRAIADQEGLDPLLLTAVIREQLMDGMFDGPVSAREIARSAVQLGRWMQSCRARVACAAGSVRDGAKVHGATVCALAKDTALQTECISDREARAFSQRVQAAWAIYQMLYREPNRGNV